MRSYLTRATWLRTFRVFVSNGEIHKYDKRNRGSKTYSKANFEMLHVAQLIELAVRKTVVGRFESSHEAFSCNLDRQQNKSIAVDNTKLVHKHGTQVSDQKRKAIECICRHEN